MLFYCNPNNPVASLVDPAESKEFIPRVLKMNKDLRILVDEAYIDYVTTPGHETMIPQAIENPRLIVARTFSKAYGMAGLRIGYAIAHEDTVKELSKFHMGNAVSSLSYAAAIAALQRDASDPSFIPNEQKRNDEARSFTRKWFHDQMGLFDERNLFEVTHPDFPNERLVACRNPELAERRRHKRRALLEATCKELEAQSNFLFVDVQMPIEDFQGACRKEGVRVGRPFPPLWTHCRISVGTMKTDDLVRSYKC